ncbi:MAG: transglutaminase-like domain-containing protein [Desulfuromonadaceae bacterium]|nr:transglutaminase-like domain-containing protein [Desulfuromonadaceae bacterium]MDD2855252.1 transglutaminase-like domain-containing protein [Desulfuromonadaceae bacterium]
MGRYKKIYTRFDYRMAGFVIALLIAAFISGHITGRAGWSVKPSFHDMLVNHPKELSVLITPNDRRIRKLAESLGSYENAYIYVRDRIGNDPSIPAVPAGDIIAEGRASCFGKAILLCSIYRALGKPASEVRIVIGEADLPTGGFDHAWLELEHDGQCLQQDSTNILGTFAFAQFRGTRYVETFIRDEEFVLNDKRFAIVSQLNRLKGTGHPRF